MRKTKAKDKNKTKSNNSNVKLKTKHDATKVIGYNGNNKDVYNSIGGTMINDTDHRINFVKDKKKLLKSYSNLIKSIGHKYSSYCKNYADRQDLYSYISECFITLVYEYSMTNTMDFPGYIGRMLDLRVRGSYINRKKRMEERETTLKNPSTSVESVIDARTELSNNTSQFKYRKKPNKDEYSCIVEYNKDLPGIDTSLIELKDEINSKYKLTKVQGLLIDYLAKGSSSTGAIDIVSKNFGIEKREVLKEYRNLKNILSKIYEIKN